jgi:hypothetical protein
MCQQRYLTPFSPNDELHAEACAANRVKYVQPTAAESFTANVGGIEEAV